MVEADADAAPAEERVGLLDGEVGQGLVAADVEGAHGHRPRGEHLDLLPVDFALLVFRGKAFLHEEGNFGAVQADPFGAPVEG